MAPKGLTFPMRIPRPAQIAALVLSSLVASGCSQQAPKQPPTQPANPTPAPPAAPSEPPAAPVKRPEKASAPPSKPAGKAAPAAPQREKLGAGQCRTCHRLQYDSWVKSGHARKALDCEGCHGNGSEYAKASVMKDLAAAKRAGLIFQTADFCEKCHPTADASYLPKAHAHKKK
jgi:hypothetical protein